MSRDCRGFIGKMKCFRALTDFVISNWYAAVSGITFIWQVLRPSVLDQRVLPALTFKGQERGLSQLSSELAVTCNPYSVGTQQTRDIEPMLVYCWADVADGVPTLNQHWFNVSCLPGIDFIFDSVDVRF